MSDSQRSSSRARALDALVVEARKDAPPPEAEIDWDRLEARLMAEVTKETEAEGKRKAPKHLPTTVSHPSKKTREAALRGAGVVLAAAAAVFLFMRGDDGGAGSGASKNGPSGTAERVLASELQTTERAASGAGSGDVHIGSDVATAGHVVRSGDSIQVEGARAVFERSRKVTWLVEPEDFAQKDAKKDPQLNAARVQVKSAGESLIVGLSHGVIEAQVTPVPSGEAFAVDVATDRGTVRVAVHGTHLRVQRSGDRVVVDLTEGVVSIGVPPRTGVTYGTLVTAPAHVELDATDLSTLRIDHNEASIRAAVPLGQTPALRADTNSGGTLGLSPTIPAPTAPTTVFPNFANNGAKPGEGENSARATLATPVTPVGPTTTAASGVAHGAVPRPIEEPGPASAIANKPNDTLSTSRTNAPPRETIASAVRACAAARSRSGDVHVTVTSNLRLRVSASGVVESAQFSPPLLPEIQTCAAQAIYKTKLEETGAVTIPIEFSY
jgi:ferric-dicitrate binding protein FerR (iron transport regulator)